MAQELFSVFEVAERLKLHVKTVRIFVREGKLKATRIGKQYRISRADLEAFTGHPVLPTKVETAKRNRHIEVSSIVQIDAISPDAATKLESSLREFIYGRAKGEAVRIETMYDPDVGRLKIILLGGTTGNAAVLKLITALVES